MSSAIPSPEECLDLLKKSGCSDKVIRHCKAVRDVAVRMAKKAIEYITLIKN